MRLKEQTTCRRKVKQQSNGSVSAYPVHLAFVSFSVIAVSRLGCRQSPTDSDCHSFDVNDLVSAKDKNIDSYVINNKNNKSELLCEKNKRKLNSE